MHLITVYSTLSKLDWSFKNINFTRVLFALSTTSIFRFTELCQVYREVSQTAVSPSMLQ